MSQTGGATPPPPPWTSHTHIHHIIPNSSSSSSKKNNTSRRRFQDQQIRCLETIFQEEARPELRLKQELANQLGLQSRQVAIWFQNKRARSKTKRIEQQYNILKASYDDLTSKFEALKKENHSLLIQVQRLRQLSAEYGLNDSIKLQTDEMPKFQMLRRTPATTQNYGEKTHYLEQQSPALHATDACLPLPEESCSFQTDDHLEYQSCNSQLWEW